MALYSKKKNYHLLKYLLMNFLVVDNNQEMEFEPFDIDRMESYDDEELAKTRYRTSMDELYSNDIPFMFPSQANRRRRRGIIDECCKRACYKNELIKYCPPIKG
jgi:Insulin/IGF/Relaxin family